MDQIENDKRNETFVYNSNGFDIYSNAANSLNVACGDMNAACDRTNDFVMSDMAPDGRVDLTMQSYPTMSSNEAQYNYVNEQVSIQNPPQSVMNTYSSLPSNPLNMTFNPPQMPTSNSEIFRFMIPGFQIVVIPMTSPFANLSNFDMQYQFQQDHAFSSHNSSQLYQDVSGVSGGSFVNIHNINKTH